MARASLAALVSTRRPGRGLERDFYFDEELYRLEQDVIWRKNWLFVGHSVEIPEPGDYLALALLGDGTIVMRQTDGGLAAFANVCRHRGSELLSDDYGHVSQIVCPYHQWTYGLEGWLRFATGATEQLDAEAFALHRLAVREEQGLIFCCLSEEPPTFDPSSTLASATAQGLDSAKVAVCIDYEVGANWKLVWENNRECAHCEANHPQYVRANFDRYDASDLAHAELLRGRLGELEMAGLTNLYERSGLALFPDQGGSLFSVSRTALVQGYLTESMTGARVAPAMGHYQQEEVGTLRLRALPNFWCHASIDHAVTTRLLPSSIGTTAVRVSWLVDKDATEGRDYDRSALIDFWRLTSEQDWTICERQQRGITSRAYRPGPLSESREVNVEQFLSWYVATIAAALS